VEVKMKVRKGKGGYVEEIGLWHVFSLAVTLKKKIVSGR
jgi:hypothetical protein